MFGIYTRIFSATRRLYNFSQGVYYKVVHFQDTFKLKDQKFSYFIHPYNFTWRNERIVEIPIIKREILDSKGKDILEIGNVLSNYFVITHDVIDKYEKADNVINLDILDFKPKKRYDLIVSISTLEHIGWDEPEKDDKKVLKVIAQIKSLLKPGGKIMVTIPMGYNPFIDQYITNNQINFSEKFLLIRTSKKNIWLQASWDLNKNIKYNYPFPFANGVVVGIIDK